MSVDVPSEEYYSSWPDLEVTTSRDAECRYSSQDKDYEDMNYFLEGSEIDHSINFGPLSEGEHTYYIKCKTSDNVYSSDSVTFTYDVTPPEVVSYTPTETVSSIQVTVAATTDEEAVCRYSTTAGTDYDDMNALQSSNHIKHSLNLLNLEDGTYKYYVKCVDLAGNLNDVDYKMTLSVDNPPSASIDIDDNEPLSRGIYDVTLTISEDLAYAPTLRLNVDGDMYDVFLEGEGIKWEGRLSLTDEDIDNVIGQFVFTGVDLTGNTGNKVESGSTIKIDTKAPEQVENVALSYENGRVKISWREVDEDVDRYVVYSSYS